MTTDISRADFERLQAGLDKRLEEHADELKEIRKTLETIAVQKNRLDVLEKTTSDLWLKWDSLIAPGGTISRIEHWQAGCPRAHIKWLWGIVTGDILALIVIVLTLMGAKG